jgi:hypothetical protein
MKSNSVEFQSYMIECASSLGQELEHPTGALLLPLVQLQNMADVNYRNLSTVDNTMRNHMNGLDIEMKVQSFQAEFKPNSSRIQAVEGFASNRMSATK